MQETNRKENPMGKYRYDQDRCQVLLYIFLTIKKLKVYKLSAFMINSCAFIKGIYGWSRKSREGRTYGLWRESGVIFR